MGEGNRHARFVGAWFDRVAVQLTPGEQVALLERALSSTWRCALHTIGEVTLHAILRRVVAASRDRFPWLGSVSVDADGIGFRAAPGERDPPADEEGPPALHALLVEFLTVLGRLTGEILTEELHEELSRVEPGRPPGSEQGRTEHDHVE